jgi:hypothetical protein
MFWGFKHGSASPMIEFISQVGRSNPAELSVDIVNGASTLRIDHKKETSTRDVVWAFLRTYCIFFWTHGNLVERN